jgi:hypothetical protein
MDLNPSLYSAWGQGETFLEAMERYSSNNRELCRIATKPRRVAR